MATRNTQLIQWAASNQLLPGDEDSINGDEAINHRHKVRLIVANQILDCISKHPGVTSQELATLLDLNQHTIVMHCLDLESAGLIEVEESPTNGAPKRHYRKL